ncbi:GNAT family N-acetyltransferase, partial [Escherichia coli]|nr:GNAT family N-acetyltransferase [Escherichia coli]
MNNIQIRNYQPGDFQQLCAIFLRAVTMTASQHYSPQQIAAWAQIDESRWKEKLAKSQVRVAVINAQPVGFITRIGHYIDMLFVEPEYTRRGVASAGNDSNLLIVFYVQIMPDDFVMQLHR